MIVPQARPAPRPIEALAPGRPGRYEDDVVVVERAVPTRGRRRPGWVRTPHFDIGRDGQRLHVVHDLSPEQVDDDLTGLLARELFDPGWVSGADAFERIFTGLVRSSRDDPIEGWELFYRNTLAALEAPQGADRGTATEGSIDGYRPVYRHALSLVPPGSVLELGCCFGFLSLQLAARGDVDVLASDVSAGTIAVLEAVARRLGAPVRTLVADATRVPLPNACTDTVLAVHLIEHLDEGDGARVVAEALRLARRRVVVAVPFEQEPAVEFGHLRTFDLAAMRRLADDLPAGWDGRAHSDHGGWLVADRQPA